jgi:hypothetical protein
MSRCGALVLVVAFAVLARAAEPEGGTVDNPAYKNWSAFKPGTAVTLKRVVVDKSGDAPGVVDATAEPDAPHESYTTYKLVSVTPEQAVVEMTETDIEGGNEVEHAPVKITYRPRLAKKYAEQGLPKSKVSGLKEGEETLTVDGQKVETHWVESEFSVENETSWSKVWASDEVPGGTVKRDTLKKENGKVLFETKVEVVRLKVEK